MSDPPQTLRFKNRKEWRAWLARNHDKSDGVFLRLKKKYVEEEGLGHNDALEEALCFGWIDSKLTSLDEKTFALKFSPRRKDSLWSEHNKKRALSMIRSGRMTEAGLKKISEAKANGRWDSAYSLNAVPKLPDDLVKALRDKAGAWKRFEDLPNSQKVSYIFWINEAKREDTRRRRISETVQRVVTGAPRSGT
ncbi:MAG TPA: YdeI/OmpD-associated family protein [Thermoplasmata archaeon]|nr:YdeI/OmpD-associated family protein [Thermoplasmata archaeon]